MSEPVRHHYIPQFILRNFCIEGNLNFWNHKDTKFEKRNTKSVFMVKNLYKDIKNYPDDIMVIEKKFAKLEDDIAKLISEKILNKKIISLTRKENEVLRKFLFLLSFRSENRRNQYLEKKFDVLTKASLKPLVQNNDYIDLWLKEINEILDADSFDTLKDSKILSWEIKTDLQNELLGYYMTFVESRGQDFILSDIYPTTEIYPINFELKADITLHSFFPLTPSLILILNHVMFREDRKIDDSFLNSMITFSNIKGNMLVTPKAQYVSKRAHSDEDIYHYHLKKIYQRDVEYINKLFLNEVKTGFVCTSYEKIKSSVKSYNSIDIKYRKNDFSNVIEQKE